MFGLIEKAVIGSAKGIGKAAFSTAKLGITAGAYTAAGVSKGVGKGAGLFGKGVMNSALSSPGRVAAFAVGAGATGYALADIDGRRDRGAVAGSAAMGAVAATAMPGLATAGATVGAAGVATLGGGALGAAGFIGRKAIKMPTEPVSFTNMGDLKFSALGTGMLLGGAAIEGTSRAARKFEQIRMGQHDGQMRKATPLIPQAERQPSYANNGGATGDLVFAMYNNR